MPPLSAVYECLKEYKYDNNSIACRYLTVCYVILKKNKNSITNISIPMQQKLGMFETSTMYYHWHTYILTFFDNVFDFVAL